MRLLDQVRWFPGARELVFVPEKGIEVPERLRGVPMGGEWTAGAFEIFLAGLREHSWVAPVATVDIGELGAHDTPERALLDYLDGGLPPLWNSREKGTRCVLLGGTVTGPGGTLVSIVDTDGSVRFEVAGRVAAAVREVLVIVRK